MSRLSFYILCLMFFALSFGVAAMAALVPSIASYFGVEARCAVKLTWLYMLPYGVFALIWAPLTNIFKLKNLFLIISSGFFLASLLFCLSKSIHQAFVYRFLMGAFGCGFVPLSLIAVGKVVKAKSKAKYIGVFFGISYISTFISVFLSGFVSWRIIYLIPAVLGLITFFLVLRFLNDFDFRKKRFKITYLDTLKDKQALSFFAVIMVSSFLYHSLQQRLGVYLSDNFSLKQVVISSVFTVSTFAAIAFEFLGGFFSSRFGFVKITRIGFFLMTIFSLSLLFVTNYVFLFVLIALWGSGWALSHVGLSSRLTHFEDSIMRDASSLNSALRFSFGGLGAFAGGMLATSIDGYKILFVLVTIFVFILGLSLNNILGNGLKD